MSALLTSREITMAGPERHHPIPPITDPMGKSWRQPNRFDIEIDDTHALMSQKTFDDLANYSYTKPTGVYVGKMWKTLVSENRRDPKRLEENWVLCWFGSDPDPRFCSEHFRKILIA